MGFLRFDACAHLEIKPVGRQGVGELPPFGTEAYMAFKAATEQNLLAQFERHFPALAPMVVVRELSTPLTTAAHTGAQQGAIYGLEVSPRRFLSDSLRARTLIPGLFLTGHDVVTPGVTGAMMGGVLAAAGIAPGVYSHLQ